MTLDPATAHGTRPLDCTGKELKCEPMTNAVVTSRPQSEIPRTISGVCQFAESECQNNSVPIYSVGAEKSDVLWRDEWIAFLDQIHECPSNGVTIYLVGAERSGILCRDDWISFIDQIREVSIPNHVNELCERCFKGCKSLRRATFGPSSSLERIGVSCFEWTGLEEFAVPDSVRELCDHCFKRCMSLRRVTFGPASSLERIGVSCFVGRDRKRLD